MSDPLPLSRITAVMLGVRDINAALAFYKDKLGLKLIMQEPALALLQCGNVMIGLSPGHVRLAPQVAGATEVSFGVDNLRATHKALMEKGVTFTGEPRQATPTDWAVHFKDVDGHLLSLFGPEGKA
ncbi:MAG TPA: VOC family protein [Candidatus Angelobacter sp.]|jgi:catechol 2,3-dioxygenase-like lactoylglutathione lyase family enzyme